MNTAVFGIAGPTRNPCGAGRTVAARSAAWMPGQARHDKWAFSVIADLIRNPCPHTTTKLETSQ
jgi:hypothetical protein